MGKLVVSEYVTLDGVMEDPGGGEKFVHGGWSFPFWNDEAARFKFEETFAVDALLLGRVTYEGFAKAWPSIKDEQGFADRMNSFPKYVVTSTLQELTWNNSHPIRGDIAAAVQELKQANDNILVAGSNTLVQALLQQNLVDEIRLLIHPIVVGNGKRLFQEGTPKQTWKLVDCQSFQTGILAVTYHPGETA